MTFWLFRCCCCCCGGTVTDKDIEKYYDNKAKGDVEISHILITADVKDDMSEDEAKEARRKYSDALFITLFWLLTLKPEEAAVISKRLVDDFGTK